MGVRLFDGVRPLGWRGSIHDALAGISLASMNIPQVLGYTRIAGTPVVTGLYTVLLPLVAFATFGSSRHLVVAADSATAAIMSATLSQMAPIGSVKYVALTSMLALLTAALLAVGRIFRLGFLADFLARTVLMGFLTGVGVQVGTAMLGDMLGLELASHRTLAQLAEIAGGLGGVDLRVVGLSALTVGAILLSRHYARRVPMALVVIVGMIAASAAFGFAAHGIPVIDPVPGGLPAIGLPDVTWDETWRLLPVAGSCFVMIIAQSAATSRVYAVRHRERVDANRDIAGLAAANALAGLSGAFVVNGSPTQTAMAESAGTTSQFAQLAFAAVVVLVLLFLTGPLHFLPRAVLAGVVFTIAVPMIDLRGILAIRGESPEECALALFTAASVVVIGVEEGILAAIALSLVRHVRHSYRAHRVVLAPDDAGHWLPVAATPGVETAPGLIVYRFGADLFYANADRFTDNVLALVEAAPDPVRWFVVDAGAVIDLDYSAARSVRDLIEDLDRRGVALIFGRVSDFLRHDLDRHGIAAAIGPGRIFATLHEAIAAARGA